MPFAIVDIETTGGYAAANGITEIAIRIHDGKSVIDSFETLINPGIKIPYYIRGLTGINDAMVANAPRFAEVAEKINNLLQGNIFIAHSVNFDYSFIKHALAACGYELNLKKLCTVRLSRQIFPGLRSYSLGNICGYLNISIKGRHRAGGDAEATVQLFEQLLANDNNRVIEKFQKRNSRENMLPPNVPKKQFEQLPDAPGVYYFHDSKGKILYVGKALSIKKRVTGHFSNNSPNKQKQDFLRNVYNISCEPCGNELMALILESHQIKHYWPQYNRVQKRNEAVFGIIDYTDQRGFKRLAIEKMKRGVKPLAAFGTYIDGLAVMRQVTDEFDLCHRLTGIATDTAVCEEKKCACLGSTKKKINQYNKKVEKAVSALTKNESFVILEEGRKQDEIAVVMVEKGEFKRMGFINPEELNPACLTPEVFEKLPMYRENFNIRQIISGYKINHPEKVMMI